ncbi:hypothetical protein MNBD_GAMMA23-226 [hydrothermal vent metagenome]|uniref:Uncharacterized protein n=1 Tax=hydrothermal vent metagenome TaxID=652676 RepID=A0A3B0ZSG7_9ZZZZ
MSMPSINNTIMPLRNILFALVNTVLLTACLATTSEKQSAAPVAPQAQAAYQRAVIAMKAGQSKRAFRLFNSISKKYPGFAGPQLNIGLMHLRKNRLKKAEVAFKRAIHINRDNAVGHNLLGVVYRHSGKFIEAKEAYQKALSKNSKYANAHLNLGILYDLYMDDLKRALHHYEQYQKFSKIADTKVAKWILDLKRRAKTAQTTSHQKQKGKRG